MADPIPLELESDFLAPDGEPIELTPRGVERLAQIHSEGRDAVIEIEGFVAVIYRASPSKP